MIPRTYSLDNMFLTEKQLIQVLKSNFSTMCDWNTKEDNTFLSEEVDLGFGVADLVISNIGKMSYPNILLSNLDVIVYNIIKENSDIVFEDIFFNTSLNPHQIRKSLDKLSQNKFIDVHDCSYKVGHKYEEIVRKNIAIEAKLKNWRRALSQAFRYKWFASETYVVMDSHHVHTAIKKIDEFVKLNVGLAEINVDGIVITHYKPDIETPYNNKMTMIFNERVKESLLTSQI